MMEQARTAQDSTRVAGSRPVTTRDADVAARLRPGGEHGAAAGGHRRHHEVRTLRPAMRAMVARGISR